MKLKLSLIPLLIIAASIASGCRNQPSAATQATPTPSVTASPISAASPEASRPKLDVPYVPTPESVVAKMLELAKVNKNDVVYDLGSGDGRIVITAAQKHGARGVGYDIDPQRIKEANANAQTAKVTDRVRFVQGDLFQADLSEASVVTLYLLPEINLKLRPKLLKELKPGTRIVSHNYGLGDWDPIRTETIDTGTGEHLVFYWVVPPKGTHPN
ncbi:MAG TPA: class I SAM-dependent methyltransferase [Pyrinomonadaceae bacterium]|nr:class I SAM-dependent methyltransferase [Pyrinomonadaceae bacterium]